MVLSVWMATSPTPTNVAPPVQFLGTTFSSLLCGSAHVTNEMVIACLDRRSATSHTYCSVGLYDGTDVKAKQWKYLQQDDWNRSNEIKDIGVEIIDMTKSGRPTWCSAKLRRWMGCAHISSMIPTMWMYSLMKHRHGITSPQTLRISQALRKRESQVASYWQICIL